MSKLLQSTLASFLLLFGVSAGAQEMDGNFLLRLCQEGEGETEYVCVSYIHGAIEGMKSYALVVAFMESGSEDPEAVAEWANRDLGFCAPDQMSIVQSGDVVAQFLERHPEDRHEWAPILIMKAMQEAFPCPAN